MSKETPDDRLTQCGVVMTKDELDNTQKHYFDIGTRMGQHMFNWRDFITGILIGVGAATALVLFSK